VPKKDIGAPYITIDNQIFLSEYTYIILGGQASKLQFSEEKFDSFAQNLSRASF
jgi:hypothetical protein